MNMQARIDSGSSAAADSATPPRVVIIGAGMSGLLMGIRLKLSGNHNFCIYESAATIGGTWRDNSYPNLACDVFAPAYTYSFEPNPEWNYRFGRGEEIQRYFERVEAKYGMREFIRFNNGVAAARWDGTQWLIRTTNGSEDRADVLVSAVGALHHPRYPQIEGLESFSGACFHTARWDHTVDIRGKRVGVIGTGSTAAQLVPGIIDRVQELHLFQRTPQWVFPMADKKYSQGFKRRRRNLGWLARLHHWLDLQAFSFFSRAVIGNRLLLWIIDYCCRRNLQSVRDPELRRKLTPDYPAACKRLVISEDFYGAIQKDNAHLHTAGIERIVPEGVITREGELVELDVLVLSTGFHPYKTSAEVTGENGVELSAAWGGSPLMYRTVGVPGFPNYFVLFGPYSPVGNMSIIENSEIQAEYVMRCIEHIGSGRIRAMAPREDVARRLKSEMLAQMKNTVWNSGCNSWYLDSNGDAISYPYAYSRFREELREPVLAEFELQMA